MDPWLGAQRHGHWRRPPGHGKWPTRGLGARVTGAEPPKYLPPHLSSSPSRPSRPCPCRRCSTAAPTPARATAPRPLARAAPAHVELTPRRACPHHAAPPLLLRRPSPCPRRAASSLLLRQPSPHPRRTAPPPLLPRQSPHRAAVPSRHCPWLATVPRRHALHRRPRLSLALVSIGILGLTPPCPFHRRPCPTLPPSAAGMPLAPIESDSPRGAPGTPWTPRATSVVGHATTGPDLRLDLRPSSVDPKR
ncbi:proline-rich receptor-like protein kinase PERK14 [Miscanthus floridulus]|uniref:proline-rich receptor-like protein kinase PERK14 n=1 Tax=Miscanthus floridulus TaxID=154761 RepID=UPI003457CCF9